MTVQYNYMLIIINDRAGKIAGIGLTNEKGIWRTKVSISRNPRVTEKKMGTIIVIAVADGYKEIYMQRINL